MDNNNATAAINQTAADLSAMLMLAGEEEMAALQTALVSAIVQRTRQFGLFVTGDRDLAIDSAYQFARQRLAALADLDRDILDFDTVEADDDDADAIA